MFYHSLDPNCPLTLANWLKASLREVLYREIKATRKIMTVEERAVYESVNAVNAILPDDWLLLKKCLRPASFKKGAFFIEEGRTSNEIAFVLKGAFRAFYIVEGEEKCCDFFLEGQWAKSYHNFLAKSKSKMSVQALENSNVYLLDYDDLRHLFECSAYWERFGRLVTERLFILSQLRAESFLLETAEQRYVNLEKQQPLLIERIPLYHLASYLGIKQPSLSRIRKRLMSGRRL